MNNITVWQFIICLAILILFVKILGILVKPLKQIASIAFLIAVLSMLGKTPLQPQCLLLFFLIEAGIARGATFLYQHEGGHGESYYLSLIVSLLPLVLCKYQSWIPLDMVWFLGAAFITYLTVKHIIDVNKGLINRNDKIEIKSRREIKKQVKQIQ